MDEASILEMYFDSLPKVVASASASLSNFDSVTLYSEGNQTKIVGDVMKPTNQIVAAMKENRIDIPALLTGIVSKKEAS